ncbi:hypothetical protein BJY04DRAFT_218919 [Aspergillus karnatakaensis]|uniref:uncharacterized protein n=1 Tax=Aspergillus karnatakaensis TaxID=1810916 RepID=UPI003CCD7298
MQSTPPASTSLPIEIWYIITALLDEESHRDSDDESPEVWRPEKLSKLFPYLRDLISLSSTCNRLRDILTPRIFNTLYLQNTPKSVRSLQAIAKGKHLRCVKNLHYVAICELDQCESPLSEVYPDELDSLLRNLPSLYPNLHHIKIEFPYNDEILWSEDFDDPFEGTLEAALALEQRSAWYALMTTSLNAIVSPADSNILSFEINNLIPANISTFYTPSFHAFLSRLHSFTLSIRPLDNGAGWNLNTKEIFWGFSDRLGPWFMQNLTDVKTLTFDPSETMPLGDSGDGYQSHPHDIGLRGARMPNLRSLTLRNLIICPELRDFILAHLDTLCSVSLHECYADEPHDRGSPGGFVWQNLLSDLADSLEAAKAQAQAQAEADVSTTCPVTMSTPSPPKLKPELCAFEITYEQTPRQMIRRDLPWIPARLMAQVEAKLESEPSAQPLFYGVGSDKYGGLSFDDVATMKSLLRGDDERAWKRLRGVIGS